LHEATLALRISDPLRWQYFDGDKTVKVRVTRLVNDAHPSFAKFLEDAVVRDGSTDHLKVLGFRVCFILWTWQQPVNEWRHRRGRIKFRIPVL
jgi:hypothetical protein